MVPFGEAQSKAMRAYVQSGQSKDMRAYVQSGQSKVMRAYVQSRQYHTIVESRVRLTYATVETMKHPSNYVFLNIEEFSCTLFQQGCVL